MQLEPSAARSGKPLLQGIGMSLLFVAALYLVTGIILRPIMPPAIQSVYDGIYNGLLCGSGEHYQQNPFLRGALRRNIVSSGDSWCENAGGEKRDISFSEFNVGIALFVIPLLLGFGLIAYATPSFRRAGSSTVFKSSAGGDLSSRLQELQAAYEKGLISQDEYNQTRANLLKQMEK